ncbi:hypothetical protein Bca4012_092283 [Brassica carinata]
MIQVDYDDPFYPQWFHKMIQGPIGETDFYGILQEIIEVEFPDLVKLKCVLFKCDWFDPTINRGVRYSKFGVVDINATWRYNKVEPYILASQADQICFIPYLRIRQSEIFCLAVIKVTPRGRVLTDEQPPLQEDVVNEVEVPEQATNDILLVDPYNQGYEELLDDATDEAHEDEFEENGEVDDVSDDE